MRSPRVSVICIFYQAERFLAEAVDSVLAQDFADWELLLVDDGSTDGGSAIAQGYATRHPDRIRYLDHPGHANRGMSATRNRGIAEAQGDYLAFIDADDAWRPAKLAEQVALLDADPAAAMVCGNLEYWRSWDGGQDAVVRIGPPRHGPLGSAPLRSSPPDTLLDCYPLGMMPAVSVDALVRRAVAEEVGRFEEQFTALYEDQAFFAKVMASHPVIFADRTWLRYRQHGGNTVSTAHADGSYRASRAAFLAWLESWIAPRDLPGKTRLQRAIAREQWKLAHPLAAKVLNRIQRRFPRLMR